MNKMYLFIRKYKEEILLTLGFIILARLFNNYRIIGDANYYNSFSQLLLSGFHNFNIGNQLVFQSQSLQQYGASLFYLPFQLIGLVLVKINLVPLESSAANAFFVGLGTNVYVYVSLLLLLRILKKLELPTLSLYFMFFATPMFVFAFPVIGQAHSIDVFILTLILYTFVLFSNKPFILGLLTALSIYVRYVNVIVLMSFILYFIIKEKKQLIYYLGGTASLLWFLPVSLWIFNGNLSGTAEKMATTTVNIPLIKMIPILPNYALKLLAHPLHGLFIWSPLTLLSFNGLIMYSKERRALSLLLLAWFIGIVWFYGYFYYWYAGWSFSQRYLIGLFPAYVIGFAYFMKVYPRLGKCLGFILVFYSLFLFINWGTIIHGSEGMPQDIVSAWQKNKINYDYYFKRVAANFNVKR